ncbi:hypothetical protein [Microvirga arsenatis]|uniref:Uncharacterized protein n=1 Tax=Microvirga arsenatis TaxID=2692265 RepID=A0ABW9YUT6_9HYPH|nr:hypothetical protein [Microvirga arsenatis]NBJ10944.1 hypothetical protein [Microvirga arsenatis]NBJ24159.1 hypothetical protein [Microvirga arsenatis]
MRFIIFLAGFLLFNGAGLYGFTEWQSYMSDAGRTASLNQSLRQIGQSGLSMPNPPDLAPASLAASVGFSIMLLGCALIAAGRPGHRIQLREP